MRIIWNRTNKRWMPGNKLHCACVKVFQTMEADMLLTATLCWFTWSQVAIWKCWVTNAMSNPWRAIMWTPDSKYSRINLRTAEHLMSIRFFSSKYSKWRMEVWLKCFKEERHSALGGYVDMQSINNNIRVLKGDVNVDKNPNMLKFWILKTWIRPLRYLLGQLTLGMFSSPIF